MPIIEDDDGDEMMIFPLVSLGSDDSSDEMDVSPKESEEDYPSR